MTFMKMFGNNYWYAGAGYIYTMYVFRERLSFQTGGLINFRESKQVSYFAGLDVKLLEENRFNPDVRTAIGINLKRRDDPLIRIWVEYYSGRVPYSTIEYGRVNWLGAAMAIVLR